MTRRKKSTQITSFDRSTCRLLRNELDATLKSLADKYDISIKAGGARFSSDNATFKLEIATKGSDGQVNSREKTDFEIYAGVFGFKSDDFGATFRLYGEDYTIIGLKPRSRKYPVLGKRKDGKVYKLNATDVLMAMGREVSIEAAAQRELDRGLA